MRAVRGERSMVALGSDHAQRADRAQTHCALRAVAARAAETIALSDILFAWQVSSSRAAGAIEVARLREQLAEWAQALQALRATGSNLLTDGLSEYVAAAGEELSANCRAARPRVRNTFPNPSARLNRLDKTPDACFRLLASPDQPASMVTDLG